MTWLRINHCRNAAHCDAINTILKRLFQHGLPVYRKLCFCFFQRFHPGIELGEQFLNPGNNALLLREGRDGYFKILNDILRYGFKCCPCAF